MEISLVNEQSQKLMLSEQMRQSLCVLGMSFQELTAYLTQAVTENPMLELLPPEDDGGAAGTSDADEVDAQQDDCDVEYFSGCERKTALEAYGVKRELFSDLLREQFIGKTRDEQVLRCCSLLIDCLDQRGYLCSDWDLAGKHAHFGMNTVRNAMLLLQSLEPVGVGARNLTECLLLQLAARVPYDERAAQLVRQGLPLLAKNDYKGIARLLGVGQKEALRCAGVVRSLNPIPSRGFDTGETICYVIPDVIIHPEPDGLSVSLNRATTARLSVAEDYRILAGSLKDETTKSFISTCARQAKFLIHALEDRNKTVLQVARCIARMQRDYLQFGGLPAAMTLRDIADETGFHVSTVSRAIKDKYLLCCQGTVPIKSLFSSGLRFGADLVVTPAMICRQIDALIRAENAKSPFSDEELKQELVSSGFVVSRRTIAKYRTSMGIPASPMRMRAS